MHKQKDHEVKSIITKKQAICLGIGLIIVLLVITGKFNFIIEYDTSSITSPTIPQLPAINFDWLEGNMIPILIFSIFTIFAFGIFRTISGRL